MKKVLKCAFAVLSSVRLIPLIALMQSVPDHKAHY